MILTRPDTYSPWEFVRWLLQHDKDLFVEVLRVNPDTLIPRMTRVPLCELTPSQWTYWAERFYHDATTAVRTEEEWAAVDKKKKLSPDEEDGF